MRSIERDIVSAIILSKDGKMFQGMKCLDQGGVYADCWHIPGGGVEDGETKEQSLIREIKEETGIDILKYTIELVDEKGVGESMKVLRDSGERVLCKMRFFVYRVVINDMLASEIHIRLEDDLQKYEWVSLSDLKDKKLTPPSIKLFKRLGYMGQVL